MLNPLFGGDDETEPAQYAKSPPRKERPTSLWSASFSGRRCTPRLCARVTIPKTKVVVGEVCELFKAKRATMVIDADVHRGFEDTLNLLMIARVEKKSEELRIQPVDAE